MDKSLIINKLKEHLNIKTDSQFALFLGVSQPTIASWRKRNTIDERLIITKCNNISAEWLLTGEGEMLKKEEKKTERNKQDEAALITNQSTTQIPLVGQYAYAGYLGGFDDPEYINTLPTVPIFVDRELKGNYLGFEVKGDSMEDGTDNSIKEGDILISREIKCMYWQYKLHINKWYFVIVHKTEGVLVKRISAHNVEKGTVIIHSLNPLYEDLELSLNDIAQLFNVVQIIRKPKI